ncbi:MAG: Type 1 glutamine amidotransferase-like domain-containing protein [Bacteroidetes bacterium]|nr:Type 1 glutamine amidotransferase-like domain-containing protein [Bacteroidota bacterium]
MQIILILFSHSLLSAQGYLCAIGGGSENYNDWSDEPYSWIVEHSSNNKLLILSYSDQSDWMVNYFKSFGATEVYNYKIGDRTTADLQTTYDEIISAGAVFIKGGDQWKYISYWKGTKTEDAIRYVYENGGVISGTSAGAMVLGEYAFSAKYGSAYPKESLLNPFYSKITFENDFLNLLPDVVFDTHVIQRGRWGRVIPFVFNLYETTSENVLGIAVDDMTALCIEPDGIATVMGSGAVSFYQIDQYTIVTYNPPDYTIENLKCDQLTAGFQYDISNREIHSSPESAKSVNFIQPISNPLTDFMVTGSNNISQNIAASFGEFFTPDDIVGVLYNSTGSQTFSEVTDYLSQNVQSYELIGISGSLLDDQEIADRISERTKFLLAGDNLVEMRTLSDTISIVGKALNSRSKAGAAFYFLGSNGKLTGENFTNNTDSNPDAALKGLMNNAFGLNVFSDFIFEPMIFDDSDYYENRSAALLWGMMHNQKRIGLYLNSSDYAFINSGDFTIEAYGSMPLMLVDARGTTIIDSSTYKYSSNYKARQVVSMNNLRYTISTEKKKYSLENGLLLTSIELEDNSESDHTYFLYDNYPNPFNPRTKIKYEITKADMAELGVYDLLGREVIKLVSEYQPAGKYEVEFDGSGLSSGVYLYRFSTGNNIQSKKLVLLK